GLFAYRGHLAEQRRLPEQQRHEEKEQAERRQQALDGALAAALAGDLERAEQGIRDAELRGASPGQVRWLLGLVYLQQGKGNQAMTELEEAVRLLPDSVAARALLAEAYTRADLWGKERLVRQKVVQLTPATPEDYLFRGYL